MKHIVEKANKLNNFIACNPVEDMSVNELRLFCLYLSKLNSRNPESRTVEIPLEYFESMFGVKINTTEFTARLRTMLKRYMHIKKDGKNILINLYSKFCWSEENCNCIEISCNADIEPYLFELKECYTSYEIENIVKLNSAAKIRMYEIMKQYEKIGERQLTVDELQELLMTHYTKYYEFSRNVLTPAIKDVNEYTDITISCEKVTKGRKVVALKFKIKSKKAAEPKKPEYNINMVKAKMVASIALDTEDDEIISQYIEFCMAEMKKVKTAISNPTAYLSKIITNQAENWQKPTKKPKGNEKESYDISEFEKLAVNYDSLAEIDE